MRAIGRSLEGAPPHARGSGVRWQLPVKAELVLPLGQVSCSVMTLDDCC